jgi:hypothetical protein
MMQKKIAGAYRMGLGSEISKHGIEGFYLNELFEPELDDMMQSIEMGRAFIIREYQQNRCLFSCFGKG